MLVDALKARFDSLRFVPGDQFCWSPEAKEVRYNAKADSQTADWSLLHETSHGLLGHSAYKNDFELVQMEIAAWEKAKLLAKQLNLLEINEDHIQDCLDTYRDWLHKRCTCPVCGTKSFQHDQRHYRCFNCRSSWRVTPSRFCRTYRTAVTSQNSIDWLAHPYEQ